MDRDKKYFDLQVNGYGGIDFNNDDLTADELHRACAKLREDGVEHILATIITDHLPRMVARLAALVKYRQRDELIQSVVAGLHIEGPFINETAGYRGAHPAEAIRPADEAAMKQLLDAGGGLVKLVTLAPERDAALRVTGMLARQGIIVAAGHCDPSLDQLRAALDAGLTLFTHLGNGCALSIHRHDNIIQRALSLSDRLVLCFIADGAHVPFFVLRNFLRLADTSRCVVVTDAIAPAGLGQGTYNIGGRALKIGPDLVAHFGEGGYLAGSAVTMILTEANLRQLGYDEAVCRRLLCDNPRAAIGWRQ